MLPDQATSTAGGFPSAAPGVIFDPEQGNGDVGGNIGNGGGIGVSMVPIPEANRPTTTLTYDPLAGPTEGKNCDPTGDSTSANSCRAR